MTSNNFERTPRIPPRLFKLTRQPTRPGEPLIVNQDTTAWEIYNHRAAEVDRERIKDWNDGLNTLLIFAALYSGVLTAFIIESMKLLQEDSAGTTNDILFAISRQLANSSLSAIERPGFEAPKFAVRVNCYFFTSISCSLIAALCAVLALQWVANYDLRLNTSSPEKRALQRQLRYMGMKKWKMGRIIASLPLLIFVSLFLFLIGLADWLWHVNRAVSAVVITGICAGITFYLATNIISIIWLEASFRTELSKQLAAGSRSLATWSKRIYRYITLVVWAQIKLIARGSPPLATKEDGLWQLVRSEISWPENTFIKCEEAIAEGDDTVALNSLLWLVNSIDIIQNSRNALLILIAEFMELPPHLLVEPENLAEAPWESIFDLLCKDYFNKTTVEEYSPGDLEDAIFLCKALSMLSSGVNKPVYENFYKSFESGDTAGSIFSYLATYRQHSGNSHPDLMKALTNACFFVDRIPLEYFHFILLNVRNAQIKSKESLEGDAIIALATACSPSGSLRRFSTPFIVPSNILHLISQIIAYNNGESPETPEVAFQRLLDHLEVEEKNKNAISHAIRSIGQQLIAQIERVRPSSVELSKELYSLLEATMPILRKKIWEPNSEDLESLYR
ncbi:hypothetical protein CPB86DRAFT_602186 [Serendipita vermifera]|nr:hypothetical protein CPB86DRAFT_602186 [Serendipita vermifera]